MRTKYFTLNRYYHDVKVDKAKNHVLPHIRGTILPSWDWQVDGGIVINWLWIRIRFINQP